MHPPEAGGYPLLITAAAWKYTKRTCGFRVFPEPGIRATREYRTENPVLGLDLGVALNELNKFKRSLSQWP